MPATIKRGDQGDILTFTVNMDLTGCTLRILARPARGALPTVELASQIEDAAAGIVTHTTDGTLDAVAGGYIVELEVTRDTDVFTFPTKGYETLKVVEDLG